MFLRFLLVLMVGSGMSAKAAATPFCGEDTVDIAWFLVITDTHVGCQFSCGDSDTQNLDWATGEAYSVIDPSFVINCGDLTDATNGGLIPKTQYDSEWESYREILDANGVTTDMYLDVPGNHDAYLDEGLTHYLKYAVQGSTFNRTQHSYFVSTGSSVIHLLGIATPTMNGESSLSDKAALDSDEMAFIRQALEDNADADVHMAFGHHGIKWGGSTKVGEGGDEFRELMKTVGFAAYFWGHTHDYLSEVHDGTLFTNLASLSKSDDHNVGIAAVDHRGLAVRAFKPRDWPYVVVTAPLDKGLGGGNPNTYLVPAGWANAPVRALVFAPDAPETVEFRIDSGEWCAMNEAREHVWAGTFDTTGLGDGQHTVEVRANPWNKSDTITFEVGPTVCFNGIDDDEDGLTDFGQDPGCETPADMDEFNTVIPEPIPDEAEIADVSEEIGDSTQDDIVKDVVETNEEYDLGTDDVSNGDALTTKDQEGVSDGSDGTGFDVGANDLAQDESSIQMNDAATRLDLVPIDAATDSGCSIDFANNSNDSWLGALLLAMMVTATSALRRRRW